MNFPLKIGQPRFLTMDEVLLLHGASIDMYGGSHGVLDQGKLEASLAMPRQGFSGSYAHEFPFGMSAAYGFHIAMNHPFADGNKRAAFAAMTAFLRLNGWNMVIPDEQAADMILEMIAERKGKEWLANKLATGCRIRASYELRDFLSSVREPAVQDWGSAFFAGPESEQLTTYLEAATSIPLIIDAIQASQQYESRGEHDMAAQLRGWAVALTTLHRIAEDRGYEW